MYNQGSYQQPEPQVGFVPPPQSQVSSYPSKNSVPPKPEYPGSNYPENGTNYSQLGEDNDVKGFEFNDKTIRRGFIRKVYGILMCQLLVTVSFIALFVYHPPIKEWAQTNPSAFYASWIVLFVVLIAMACCDGVRRTFPMNVIFLGIFTVAQSFMLGVVGSMADSNAVVLAVGVTAVVCLGLTLFAFQSKYDFTAMGGMLICALLVLFIFGIVATFWGGDTMQLVYAGLGTLLFSFYLVYDTQLMLGGSHKYSISPEEYVFAALNLYLDIINLFLMILRITSSR